MKTADSPGYHYTHESIPFSRIFRLAELLVYFPSKLQKKKLLLFLWPQLEEINTSDAYFQYHGTTSHSKRLNTELWRFPGQLISRNNDINIPSRLFDFKPLDYFLWDFMTSKICAEKTSNWFAENKIRAEIREINLWNGSWTFNVLLLKTVDQVMVDI